MTKYFALAEVKMPQPYDNSCTCNREWEEVEKVAASKEKCIEYVQDLVRQYNEHKSTILSSNEYKVDLPTHPSDNRLYLRKRRKGTENWETMTIYQINEVDFLG